MRISRVCSISCFPHAPKIHAGAIFPREWDLLLTTLRGGYNRIRDYDCASANAALDRALFFAAALNVVLPRYDEPV